MHIKSVTLFPDQYPTRERYPFNLDVFHQTRQLVFDTPVTLFVGENGTGKSTLLKALARACGIHIWEDTTQLRYENNPYEDKFSRYLKVKWADRRVAGSYFGADIFQHFARILDEWAAADPTQLKYFGGRSLLTQSHGQSIMSFFRNRYQIKGLYLLDEPETALSPRSQLELLEILQTMSAAGRAQFIIATHSPLLLACPGATLYNFNQAPVQRLDYEATEHYQIYKSFLEDRSKFLAARQSA